MSAPPPRKALRYWPRGQKFEVLVTDETLESVVIEAARILIPRMARKVYFFGDPSKSFPRIAEFSKEGSGLTLVHSGNAPRNVLETCVMYRNGPTLVIDPRHRLIKEVEWRAFADELATRLDETQK